MYRTIDTKFWTDPKVMKMGLSDRLLFLYLLTNPHAHPSGIYYLPREIIAVESGLSKHQIKKGIDTLSIGYLAKNHVETSTIWVVNMLKYQGWGMKISSMVVKQLASLHNSLLIKEFLEYYSELKIPYRYPIDTLSQVGPKDRDRDRDRDREPDNAPLDCPHQEIISLYHEILPALSGVKSWDGTGRNNLRTRWREDPARQSLDWWRDLFQEIRKSDFLMGRVKDFKATLNWIVGPKNFEKILNGQYKPSEVEPKEKIIPFTEKVRLGLIKD